MQTHRSLILRLAHVWIAVIVFSLFTIKLQAQSYDALWKQVSRATSSDLPETAIASLNRIIDKATTDKNSAQLFAALLERHRLKSDISPDSARMIRPILEDLLQNEPRAVEQSILHAMLASICARDNELPEDSVALLTRTHLVAALAHPSTLASVPAANYQPLVSKTKDGIYADEDLLSLLTRFCSSVVCTSNHLFKQLSTQIEAVYEPGISYYNRQPNRRAAELLLMLSMLEAKQQCGIFSVATAYGNTEPEPCRTLFSLIDAFSDIPQSIEARIAYCDATTNPANAYHIAQEGISRFPNYARTPILRNKIALLTQPRLALHLEHNRNITNANDTARIETVNLTEATLKIYATTLSSQQLNDINRKGENLALVKRNLVRSIPFSINKGESYESRVTRLPISLNATGIYLLQVVSGKYSSELQPYSISDLHVMQLASPNGEIRIAVSDARTGLPIKGATLTAIPNRNNAGTTRSLTTNADGEAKLSEAATIYVTTGADIAAMPLTVYPHRQPRISSENTLTTLRLFTDRAIYRPGQEVKVGGFLYAQQGDDVRTLANKSVKLSLRDANRKEIANVNVITDALGNINATFPIPTSGLNGSYSIISEYGRASFSVEAYKRPTFLVEFEPITTAYKGGQTVKLTGHIRTYDGMPLSATRVAVNYQRTLSPWFFCPVASRAITHIDTLLTDDKGHFVIPVKIDTTETDAYAMRYSRVYTYTVSASATAANGETATASQRLHAGTQSAYLSINMPSLICRDDSISFTPSLCNAANQPLSGNVNYVFSQNGIAIVSGTWAANKPISIAALPNIPSGTCRLTIKAEADSLSDVTASTEFTIFAMSDSVASGTQPLQVYTQSDEFVNNRATIRLASPLSDALVRLDVFYPDRTVDHRLIRLNGNAITLKYDYKEQYGDGLSFAFALVRDGKLYSEQRTIIRPRPDKVLRLEWAAFRDHLQPGQTETWTLRICKNGKPVSGAALLATLYDASLDAIRPHHINFGLNFNRFTLSSAWRSAPNYQVFYLGFSANVQQASAPSLYQYDLYLNNTPRMRFRNAAKGLRLAGMFSAKQMAMYDASVEESVAVVTADAAAPVANLFDAKATMAEGGMTGGVEEEFPPVLRQNFSELAYFAHALTSDENGFVKITFTMPDVLTSWNFQALAHTVGLDYGQISAHATVSKPFSIRPNVPRFLRYGDQAVFAASIRNTSTEKQTGHALFQILDPSDESVIAEQKAPFSVEADGETLVKFNATLTSRLPLVIVRYTARTAQFSDGEQHYVPILTDQHRVINTLPLTLNKSGQQSYDVARLFPSKNRDIALQSFTMEYTARPAWLAVEALAPMATPQCQDAFSLATQLFAISTAEHLLSTLPSLASMANEWKSSQAPDSIYTQLTRNDDLRHVLLNETPWVVQAQNERNRLLALASLTDSVALPLQAYSCLDRLTALQTAAGGWSWFPTMPASYAITVEVATILRSITAYGSPTLDSRVPNALSRAMRYLQSETATIVKQMRESLRKNPKQPPYIGSQLLRYMRLCADQALPASSDIKFLVEQLEQQKATAQNMYEKALSAYVLHVYGRKAAAQRTFQSLMEHTVSHPTMGRYFDTQRAEAQPSVYRIPTQIAALECLRTLLPNDTTTEREMLLWLLQSKRSQTWDTNLNTLHSARYLLSYYPLTGSASALPSEVKLTMRDRSTKALTEPLRKAASSNPAGYARLDYAADQLKSAPASLTLRNATASPAFGAIYVQYDEPIAEATAAGSDLSLQTFYAVRRGDSWETIPANATLHVGDLVRVTYLVKSNRDLDFVSIHAPRPACAEPVRQLSGYESSIGAYHATGDASSRFFVEHFAKGSHKVECEWRIDRAGTYMSGVPTIQCTCAPEFEAHGNALRLTVADE